MLISMKEFSLKNVNREGFQDIPIPRKAIIPFGNQDNKTLIRDARLAPRIRIHPLSK
jgi:hypothetical protein